MTRKRRLATGQVACRRNKEKVLASQSWWCHTNKQQTASTCRLPWVYKPRVRGSHRGRSIHFTCTENDDRHHHDCPCARILGIVAPQGRAGEAMQFFVPQISVQEEELARKAVGQWAQEWKRCLFCVQNAQGCMILSLAFPLIHLPVCLCAFATTGHISTRNGIFCQVALAVHSPARCHCDPNPGKVGVTIDQLHTL